MGCVILGCGWPNQWVFKLNFYGLSVYVIFGLEWFYGSRMGIIFRTENC
jgi:hypothetical protein